MQINGKSHAPFRISLIIILAVSMLGLPTGQASAAGVCYTLTSSSGSLSGTINDYWPATGDVSAGATSLSLGAGNSSDAGNDIAAGDLLLVIQMQQAVINSNDTNAYGSGGTNGNGYTSTQAGYYEYVIASSALGSSVGGTLAITGLGAGGGLINNYYNAATTTSQGQVRFQVVRVPTYLNVTLSGNLTALPWNGSTGGIVALEVTEALSMDGYAISADGAGFRGGAGVEKSTAPGSYENYRTNSTANGHASKGEGIAGTPRYVYFGGLRVDTAPPAGDGYPGGSFARGGPGTAGGGGNTGSTSRASRNSGGGGGGNGGSGGQGGNSYLNNLAVGGRPGAAFAQRSATRLVMGGGGGAGQTNNVSNYLNSSGAAGGGLIFLRTGSISGTGTLSANGADAPVATVDGGGGGGAGGSVLAVATGSSLSGLTITAEGGDGGDTSTADDYGPGGGGGGGVIIYGGSGAISLSVAGGANGLTDSGAYGATSGTSGATIAASDYNAIPGIRAGMSCSSGTTSNCYLYTEDSQSLKGQINSYWPGTANASAGATSISLGNRSGAAASIRGGDLLLVIQMQGAQINATNDTAYGSGDAGQMGSGYLSTDLYAGTYEYVYADNSASFYEDETLAITGLGAGGGLINNYYNADATINQGQMRFQVVRVPTYLNVTLTGNLTALPWNGSTGGIVALEVTQALTMGGYTISADGAGFRGGGGRQYNGGGSGTYTDYATASTNNINSAKGEGIAGTPRYVYFNGALLDTNPAYDGYPLGTTGASMGRGAPGNAGGGGTDGNPSGNDQNSGGGGGGNGGAGGLGGNSWSSAYGIGGRNGASFSQHSYATLVMGGGGGAGTTNNGTPTGTSGLYSSGAAGGGIVFLRAGSINGTGTLSTNGATALNVNQDGAGGGGAGGSVLAIVQGAGINGLTITANGGNGGNAWITQPPGATYPGERHGPGGGGGGGVIYTSGTPASATAAAGTNGVTTTTLDAYGATPGMVGITEMGNQSTGATSSAICWAQATAVKLTSLSAASSPPENWVLTTGLLLTGYAGACTLAWQLLRPVKKRSGIPTTGGESVRDYPG